MIRSCLRSISGCFRCWPNWSHVWHWHTCRWRWSVSSTELISASSGFKQHGYNDYNLGPAGQNLVVSNSQHCDRTTRMLLAILLMFLITEFPSGLVALLSGILGDSFQLNVYHKLGEMMDLLALVNSAVNFILYCTMSRQFRKTFTKTVLHHSYRRGKPSGRPTQATTIDWPFHLQYHLRLNGYCGQQVSTGRDGTAAAEAVSPV